MGKKQKGKASVLFECPPLITAAASVVGKKEGEGPLGRYFDQIEADSMLGKKTWEEAESELQTRAARLALAKSGLSREEIRYYFGGDLLAQLIATSFGAVNLEFPLRFRGSYYGGGFQSFRLGGEAVSLSSGIWEPKALFRHLDGDGLRDGGDL